MNDPEVIEVSQFSWQKLLKYPILKRKSGNKGMKKAVTYLQCVTAFDIETTNIKRGGQDESIMYSWAFQLDVDLTVLGRYWEEYQYFVHALDDYLEDCGAKLVVYVHNLSYEFQFLRTLFEFSSDDVFCMKPHKILTAKSGNLEYRCSYIHSNMSLAEYTKKMKVFHVKQSGEEFDYSIQRYPWTPLSATEKRYIINDVLGLVEALKAEMELEGDDLYSIPLTSTGYVRRDAKKAMTKFPRDTIAAMLPDWHIYSLARDAFRGGNCHANRYYSGALLKDVWSDDRSSSYPDTQVNDIFPMTPFEVRGEVPSARLEKWIFQREKAVLFRAVFVNIRLKDIYWGCPYLSFSKCRGVSDPILDNGRILQAESLETALTDVDYRIILEEYEWDQMIVIDSAVAGYGRLPEPLLEVTRNYYRMKTALKDVEGQEVYYTKAKNKLNSIYGMSAQDPVKPRILLQDGVYKVADTKTPEEILISGRKRQFMPYQWGVWVTAWARYRLEEGICLAGEDFVYCDTDSVKHLEKLDWGPYNKERMAQSQKNGAWADDRHGVRHYMGVYESEGSSELFRTWGAKKYAYVKNGRLHVTVSGVVKRWSAEELEDLGGIESFKPGVIFKKAGGIAAVYNDHGLEDIELEGRHLLLPSNCALIPSTYTLGLTSAYEKILRECNFDIDIW